MRIQKKNVVGLAILLVALLLVGSLAATEDTDPTGTLSGDEILKKVEENTQVGDTRLTVSEMIIVHKTGAERVMEMKIWMKGDDYLLVRFLSPPEIKGTGVLVVGNDMWLYLPALGTVRQIETQEEKEGSFMGSDFTYADAGSGSMTEDYDAELLTTEEYEGRDCYILELTPKDPEETSYSRLKLWVDKEYYYSVKTEYYDEHGDLLKVSYESEIERVEDVWVTKRMEMESVQEGSKTIIVTKEIELSPEIPDEIFTIEYLQSGDEE